MKRIEAIEGVLAAMPDRLVVCYAGAACEELYARGDEDRFLYVLGSMGLASSVGLGIALASRTPVVALEGDASVLMNLGTLVTIAQRAPRGFVLGIVDNGQNASTGGQPTATGSGLDLAQVARATGSRNVVTCTTREDIEAAGRELSPSAEPLILHLRIAPGDGPRRVVDLEPVRIRDRARVFVAR
jgi:sulfopyruvate decarboxylase subunit beta